VILDIHERAVSVGLALVLAVVLAGSGAADTVNLTPSKDNTIFETPNTNSNGKGDGIYAGRTSPTQYLRRGLIAFDLTPVPADATINSVELELQMVQTISGPVTVTLQRLRQDWGEGNSSGPGTGAPAQVGDATWLRSFYDTVSWLSSGGFAFTTVSASQTVGDLGTYKWSGPGMIADVNAWLSNPAVNFGWLIKSNEGTGPTTKKFGSKESFAKPVLRIEFTPATTLAKNFTWGRLKSMYR
jgi:hypothetical protein